MSLKSCIESLGPILNDYDVEAVVEAAAEYQSRGMSQQEAEIRSVEDYIAELEREKAKIEGEVVAAYESSGAADAKPRAKRKVEVPPNALVTEDEVDEIRKQLRAKLGQLNAGIDPEVLALGVKLAAYHIERGARTFAAYARAMVEDMGEAIKPYLKQFYAALAMDEKYGALDGLSSLDEVKRTDLDAILNAEEPDVSGSGDSLEPDRGQVPAGDAVGEAPVRDGSGAADGESGGAGEGAGEGRAPAEGDSRVSNDGAAAGGERDDQPVHQENGEYAAEGSTARSDDAPGGARSGPGGVPTGGERGPAAPRAPQPPRSVSEKRAAQRAAANVEVVAGDPENVAKSLPFLLEGQHEDVVKAEQRFTQGAGILFTNGTGTGKTYTGLGIIYRHIKATKDNNVLIVVPTQPKVTDWVRDGQNLDLTITPLQNKKDVGSGPVITTYANFRDNLELAKRDFSLIVYDESHYLKLSADDTNDSYHQHRALARHPEGLFSLAQLKNPEYREFEYARRKAMDDAVKAEEDAKLNRIRQRNPSTTVTRADVFNANERKAIKKEASEKFVERNQAFVQRLFEKARVDEEQLKAMPKARVVFLSASPFPYHFSLDYAEGFLFDFPQVEGGGYNSPSGRSAFYMSALGYRMRYGKLTQPEAGVDQSLMERQFAEQLRKQRVMSGRLLETGFDYSRQFVLFPSDLGAKIQRGIDELSNWDPEEQKITNKYELLPNLVRKKFNAIYLSQLREGILVGGLKERIDQHLAMGRKVVLFHDFRKSISEHPFNLRNIELPLRNDPGAAVAMRVQLDTEIARFEKDNKDLVELPLNALGSVVTTVEKLYGDRARYINGDISPKAKDEAIRDFNSDGSGVDIIVVQRLSGREGISLHDTTGKHQRALLDLGLPIAPVDALQTEGRINRYGVRSNAVIEYAVLATRFERNAFFTKVSERASTAENLAMGDFARGLKAAFKEGYGNAERTPPSGEQGTGGMAADRVLLEVDDFERAKSFYWARQKKTQGTKAKEGKDYFPTPEPVGLKMTQWTRIRQGGRILEPSAGHGAIARWFPETTDRTAIEQSPELASQLNTVFEGRVIRGNFEDHNVVNKYDAVVMNPPFGLGGSDAIPHMAKAFEHLREGGRLVALIPEGPAADKRFDKWYEETEDAHIVRQIGLPVSTFSRAAAGVKTRIVIIDRVSAKAMKEGARLDAKGRIDLSGDKPEQLFVAIRDIEAPELPVLPQKAQKEPASPAPAAMPPTQSAGYKTADFKHTQTGEPVYVAAPTERTSEEQYRAVLAVAKANGGWWNRVQGGGAVRGFAFKSAEARAAFLEQVDGKTQFSLKTAGDGISVEDASAAVRPFADRVAKDVGLTVTVVASQADLPAHIRAQIPQAGRPHALVDGTRVYIIAGNLASKADAKIAAAHEILGHVGIEATIEDWADVRRTIAAAIEAGNRRARDIAGEVLERYGQLDADTFAREFIAVAAERREAEGAIGRLLSRVRAAVRRFLMGLGLDRAFHAWEIDRWLADSENYLKSAQRPDPVLSTGRGEVLMSAGITDDDDALSVALKMLGDDDEAFAYPRSNEKDLAAIAKEVSAGIFPNIEVEPIESKLPDHPVERYFFIKPNAVKKKGMQGDVTVRQNRDGTLEMDISLTEPGEFGSLIYQIVGDYAHNNGLVFIGDTMGLSPAAQIRRTEAMLSSALRWGTTAHLRPHELQIDPEVAGVRKLDWQEGNDSHNLRELAITQTETAHRLVPDLRKFDYNSKGGHFTRNGEKVDDDAFNDLAREARGTDLTYADGQGGMATPTPVGRRSLKRAVWLRWLSRAASGRAWRSLLVGISRLGNQPSRRGSAKGRITPPGIFYSMPRRRGGDRAPRDPLMPTEQPPLFDAGFDLPSETVFDYLVRNLQDRFRRVKILQRAIAGTGRQIDESSDPYLKEEIFHGKVAARLEDFMRDRVEPLMKSIAAAGVTVEELDDYLYAKHARERNERIAAIRQDMPDGGSGVTNQEAQDFLDSLPPAKRDTLDLLARRVWAINRERIDLLDEHGLEPQQVLDGWRNDYEFYVPLRGFADTEIEESMTRLGSTFNLGRGIDVRGKESKRALGRRSLADSPLLYSIAQMQSSIIRAEKNAVGRALLKLVLENPNESLYTVHRGGWGDMKPAWDEKSKEVVYRRDPLSTLGDNVVAVKQDGKQYFIVFEDEGNLLARAFKNLGVEKSNIVVRTLASLNRYLAAINTSLNPDFVLSNFVRDLQTATINLVGEQDARGALREPQQMARRVLKDIPKAMRGAMLGLYDTDPTDPWVQAFDEFREAGGMINFYSMKDLDALREELLRMTEESSKQGFSPLRAARALGEHMSRLNGAVENAVRLSTYKNARDAGLSRDRAASLARNITVNFTRKGEFGNVGNALYLFYNASLQGSVRLLYAAAKSPRVQKILGGIAVSGFLWGLTLRLLAGDDDDGENRYDKIPDYIKTRNIVLWIDDDGAIWKWPLPYGYNVPWVFGTYMENVIAHPDRRGHGALVMAQALAESFNPLGGADSDDAYRWVAKVVSPTVTDPLLELALNEDFAGRPIRREQPDWGPPVPEHQLYWNSVSPLYRETTKVLSDLTGGNDIIPGAVDINPENVEYTVDFLTGGVGRSIRSLVEMPVKAIKGDEIRAGDIPVFRRFRGDPNEQYTWQRYDEIKDEVQLVVKREKALLEDASTRRDVPEYRKEHQTLLRLEPYVRQAESELNRLYKERRTIRNRDLPEDKRKEMTEAIDARIEAARKRLIKRYNDVRAQ